MRENKKKMIGKISVVLAAMLMSSAAPVRAENVAIVLDPPNLDFAAVCEGGDSIALPPLDQDWTAWDGTDFGLDVADAVALSREYQSGSDRVAKSPATAQRILEAALDAYPDRRNRLLVPLARVMQVTATGFEEIKQAEVYLQEAYENGNDRAALALGQFYGEDGPSEMRNAEEAEHYLRLSALSGDVQGLVEYAHLIVADADAPEALRKASVTNALLGLIDEVKKGDCRVLNKIGLLYLQGNLVEQDVQTALKWIEAFAETGEPKAANNLSNLYVSRIVGQFDIQKSMKYLKQAADGGIASAQFNLGKAHASGVTVEKDLQAAEHYFLSASSQGLDLANEWLARLYAGDFGGTPDEAKAKLYFEKALKNPRRTDGLPATYGGFLAKLSAPEERQRAVAILKAAADSGSVEAANKLANIFLGLDGASVPQLQEAREYFLSAAKRGDSDSASKLAKMYTCGIGVPVSTEIANDWRLKAAVLGGEYSIYITGLNYLASSDEAVRKRGRNFIKQAAFKGSPEAIGYALARWEKGADGFEKQPEAAMRLETFVENLKNPKVRERAQLAVIRNRFELASTEQEKAAQISELDPLLATGSLEAHLTKADLLTRSGSASSETLLEIYRLTAEQGDSRGQREYGKLLVGDLSQDISVGQDWLSKAAEAGDFKAKLALLDPGAEDALFQMAEISSSGEVCTVDEMVSVARVYSTLPDPEAKTLARYWLSVATSVADQDADDLYTIGAAFLDGVDGIDQRFQAEQFFLNAVSLGRSSTMRELAEGHLNGTWRDASPEQAHNYLNKLRQLGDKEAGNKLLSEIADGRIKSDLQEVTDLLDFLGEELRSPGKYLLKLARLNLEGALGETDREKVLQWLTLSANDGEPNSMYRLYLAYFFGDGAPKDIPRALEWLTKSAESENLKAMRDLAVAYKVGVPGLLADEEQALYWQDRYEELQQTE